jgi:hypothetical protein
MRVPLSLAVLLLAGCAQCPQPAPVTRVIDTACDWVKPITASLADTPDTLRQVLAHDQAIRKNCAPVPEEAR